MSELIQVTKPKVRAPNPEAYARIQKMVKLAGTNTVCQEARCPNIGECWSNGTATMMIMGDTCTRACRYCHVKTARVGKPLDPEEPKKVAGIVRDLKLKYAVITSVDRDDLEDFGSAHFAETIKQIHQLTDCSVEVLTPDYTAEHLKLVIDAKPEVFAHNIEAAERIFKKVRAKGDYAKSLDILKQAKVLNPNQKTKSAIMVGFGETKEELIQTMKDLRAHDCDFLSMGQYLRPTQKHVKLEKYYTPDEFDELAEIGRKLGFLHVEAGPLVRSSYRADKLNAFVKPSKS
ncbi:MAG: lipoyl synthase [Nanoarchaeota archaeon]|nr:lipoyl synthase [Nanoarchaeota archaeon]